MTTGGRAIRYIATAASLLAATSAFATNLLDQLKEREGRTPAAPSRVLTPEESCELWKTDSTKPRCRDHYLKANYVVTWKMPDAGWSHPVETEVLTSGTKAALCFHNYTVSDQSPCFELLRVGNSSPGDK